MDILCNTCILRNGSGMIDSSLKGAMRCRDLRYISIWQYIDTVIEYRIVILCSMNIEVSKWLCSAE